MAEELPFGDRDGMIGRSDVPVTSRQPRKGYGPKIQIWQSGSLQDEAPDALFFVGFLVMGEMAAAAGRQLSIKLYVGLG